MKRPLKRCSTRFAAIVMIAFSTSCADDPGLTSEIEQAVRTDGSAAAELLLGTLKSHLMTSIQEGGPVQAVQFCSRRALTLTDSVAGSLGTGISLKRVSERHRNPKNAPDEAEIEAIRHFESVLADSGSLPVDWVQRTASGELRYYRPLVIAPPCLACHGDPESMDPAVRAAIEERYPEDLATGYDAGDLRGLVRVTVSEERLPATDS